MTIGYTGTRYRVLSEPVPECGLDGPELDFATDLLVWLCQERVITPVAMRNALLAVRRYDPGSGSCVRIGRI